MNITFNYIYVAELTEYKIFLASGDIFCHLSESDFETFTVMCKKSGCRLLRRVR